MPNFLDVRQLNQDISLETWETKHGFAGVSLYSRRSGVSIPIQPVDIAVLLSLLIPLCRRNAERFFSLRRLARLGRLDLWK